MSEAAKLRSHDSTDNSVEYARAPAATESTIDLDDIASKSDIKYVEYIPGRLG